MRRETENEQLRRHSKEPQQWGVHGRGRDHAVRTRQKRRSRGQLARFPSRCRPRRSGTQRRDADEKGKQGGDAAVHLARLPPARLLEKFANEQYGKVNPNVKFKVDVLPQAQWHDAIFTQFAAHKTSFDMPILDSQFIGEAVTGKHIVNLTKWAEANIDLKAFSPNLLAAYGEYPQAVTGYYTKGAPLYGLPLLADCPAFINRKDIVGPHPPRTWAQMIAWGKQAMAKHKGIYGLGFQQAGVYDVAANTFNTVLWIYGGNLWNPKTHQIEGVINNAAGQKAMMVLVKAMVPQAPPGPPSCSFPWRGCSRTRSRTRRTSTPFPPSSSSSSRRSGTTPTSCARRARRATSRSARTSSTA
jgi:hypothetical protein